MKKLLILFCWALAASPAISQEKMKVNLEITSDDSIGRQLGFYIRDEVRKSGVFEEAEYEDSTFVIRFVTIDPDEKASYTAYSYVITVYNGDGFDWFVTSYVGVCGKDQVRACAGDLYANLGEQLEVLRAAAERAAQK